MNPFPVSLAQVINQNTTSSKLCTESKFNVFWISLLIFTQLTAVAYATDWAIVTLFHLPIVVTFILAILSVTAVLGGTWFAINAAINAERYHDCDIE